MSVLAAAAISSIPAIAQGITGFVQSRRAKDILNNLRRPVYEIPTAQKESLGMARTLASSNQLPNQVQAEQAINQSAANALYNIGQNSSSATEALAAFTGVAGNQMGAMTNLAGQGANFANQQDARLMGALSQYAQYQDKAFQFNQVEPFEMRLAEGQALAGAGMQNKFNMINNIAGIAANAMGGMGQRNTIPSGGSPIATQYNFNPPKDNLTIKSALLDANAGNMSDEESAMAAKMLALFRKSGYNF